MINLSEISANMEVIGEDGIHVGIVEEVREGRIRLRRRGGGENTTSVPGGSDDDHHHLTTDLVARIEGNKLFISKPAAVFVAADVLEN